MKPSSRATSLVVVVPLLLGLVLCSTGAALAQEDDDFGDEAGEAPRPAPSIPTVDGIDAQLLLDSAPEQRLVELTVGLYEAAAAYEGTCDKMWRPVRSYLDAHEAEIEAAAARIAARAPTMTPEELAALAATFATLGEQPSVRAGQDALYGCLRSADVQGKGRPLEKEMRRFYRLQEPMIAAIIGPVD